MGEYSQCAYLKIDLCPEYLRNSLQICKKKTAQFKNKQKTSNVDFQMANKQKRYSISSTIGEKQAKPTMRNHHEQPQVRRLTIPVYSQHEEHYSQMLRAEVCIASTTLKTYLAVPNKSWICAYSMTNNSILGRY